MQSGVDKFSALACCAGVRRRVDWSVEREVVGILRRRSCDARVGRRDTRVGTHGFKDPSLRRRFDLVNGGVFHAA